MPAVFAIAAVVAARLVLLIGPGASADLVGETGSWPGVL